MNRKDIIEINKLIKNFDTLNSTSVYLKQIIDKKCFVDISFRNENYVPINSIDVLVSNEFYREKILSLVFELINDDLKYVKKNLEEMGVELDETGN